MRKTYLLIVRPAAALLLILAAAPTAAEKGAILDGKTFVGETGEKGKTTGDKEEIRFANGRFRSVSCDAYGFGDAPYAATGEGSAINWTAETTSEKEGKMRWQGIVRGGNLTGSLVWAKAGQAPIEYWVRATLKN